jgi:hypothetical protein
MCAGPSASASMSAPRQMGVLRDSENDRQIRGAPRAGLVPGDDGQFVRQGGELRLPHAAVVAGAVHEHQRRPRAGALVGDLEPVRPDDLHHRHATRARPGAARRYAARTSPGVAD